MSKIKVGDTVERINGDFYGGNLHNVVTSISDCGQYLRVNGESFHGKCISMFKVVDTSKWHKHRNLIIAWAEGAEIEFKNCSVDAKWKKLITPSWINGTQYRIKPSEQTELEKLEAKYKELGDAIK
jgi:hypothetical protein